MQRRDRLLRSVRGRRFSAASVHAVFEAKQAINAEQVAYAREEVASVRVLHRTSLPVSHARGVSPHKLLQRIIVGLLTPESDWKLALGEPLVNGLIVAGADDRLDLGRVAAHGVFSCDEGGCGTLTAISNAATAFLLELVAQLQEKATVPMIDA